MKKSPTYLIGCSGYYYSSWKPGFYPAKLPSAKWLSYYSSVFTTVELNGTFYRQPTLSNLKRQYDNTGPDFKFSVKLSRYITHVQRLKNSAEAINDFTALITEGLSDKLHKFLFQMPPNFHYSEENLERILTSIPDTLKPVIEFRHLSWWNENVCKALKKHGCIF